MNINKFLPSAAVLHDVSSAVKGGASSLYKASTTIMNSTVPLPGSLKQDAKLGDKVLKGVCIAVCVASAAVIPTFWVGVVLATGIGKGLEYVAKEKEGTKETKETKEKKEVNKNETKEEKELRKLETINVNLNKMLSVEKEKQSKAESASTPLMIDERLTIEEIFKKDKGIAIDPKVKEATTFGTSNNTIKILETSIKNNEVKIKEQKEKLQKLQNPPELPK